MEHLVHLGKDKKLKRIIAIQEPCVLKRKTRIYLHLCNSIMSQQLSTKVAEVFHRRFLELYGGKEPTAAQIAATPFETLRGIGLSNAKANYVLNVANFFIDRKVTDKMLDSMSNEELIDFLSEIKGVGRWTVEMILMFTLGREDVFAVDDLGIQQAMTKLYKIETENAKEMKTRMHEISQKWKPYRTYACRYLWGWKDQPKPVKEKASK